jgi:hypothetical protein
MRYFGVRDFHRRAHGYPWWDAHNVSDRILLHPSCSAHRLLSWGRSSYRAPSRGSDSSLCPAPVLCQGVSYV